MIRISIDQRGDQDIDRSAGYRLIRRFVISRTSPHRPQVGCVWRRTGTRTRHSAEPGRSTRDEGPTGAGQPRGLGPTPRRWPTGSAGPRRPKILGKLERLLGNWSLQVSLDFLEIGSQRFKKFKAQRSRKGRTIGNSGICHGIERPGSRCLSAGFVNHVVMNFWSD